MNGNPVRILCAKRLLAVLFLAATCLVPPLPALANESADEELDAAIRIRDNPLLKKLALSFENILSPGVDPGERVYEELRVKALFSTRSEDWWLVHRPILPILYRQDATEEGEDASGLGDLSYRLYLSPRKKEHYAWGLGPAFVLPTATDSALGSGKWSIGPTLAMVAMPGRWTMGFVALQVWSVGGNPDRASVSSMQLTPVLNYVFGNQWFIGTSPDILANWKADSDNRWLVPLGAGIGRAFRFGNQAMAFNVEGYYNVERPVGAPEWDLQVSFDFLFTRAKKH